MKLKTTPWNESFLWIFAHHYVHMLDSKHECKDTKDKVNHLLYSNLRLLDTDFGPEFWKAVLLLLQTSEQFVGKTSPFLEPRQNVLIYSELR